MSRDERTRRLLSAFVSRDVYNDGKRLQNLASRLGDGYAEEINAFLQEWRILEITQVWDLDEANALRGELGRRLEETLERIESKEKK